MPRFTPAISSLFLLILAVIVVAADQKSHPRDGGARPLLKQLNEETQSLYSEVQAGLVRVQLPPPKWAGAPLADADNPMNKWGGQLDSSVCAQLEQAQKQAQKGQSFRISASVDKASSATRPATRATQTANVTVGGWRVDDSGNGEMIFRPGAGGGALQFDAGGGIDRQGQIVAQGGRINVNVVAAASFTPNNIGLLLDGDGHVLVPIYVEKEQFENHDVRVMVGQSEMSTAKFVGSDRQTNITILKLAKPAGIPVKLTPQRPMEGNLTMFLSPNTGVGRLMIWTNELRDWGVVVSMDGGVYGFARQGQFLSASGCKAVVQQLIKSGEVHRARLGLGIIEVPQNDAVRELMPSLGTQPAVRVTEVAANSPASRADLHAGDLILSINGQLVGDPSSFAASITGAGDSPAALRIVRNGQEQEVLVDLKDKKE